MPFAWYLVIFTTIVVTATIIKVVGIHLIMYALHRGRRGLKLLIYSKAMAI